MTPAPTVRGVGVPRSPLRRKRLRLEYQIYPESVRSVPDNTLAPRFDRVDEVVHLHLGVRRERVNQCGVLH